MSEQVGQHPIELVAKVKSIELNLDHSGAYRLLLEDGSTVPADFTASQWDSLESMHNRGRYKLNIVGTGDFADGRLQRVVSIDLGRTDRVMLPEDPEMPTLLHILKEIWKKYPQDTWDDVPTDAAKNLHHYLYGRPKVDD